MSSIVSAFQNLKLSKDYFEDYLRERPGTRLAIIIKGYLKKIDWLYTDAITNPGISEVGREGIKREFKTDPFAVPAINEKIALLPPERREEVEKYVDGIITQIKESLQTCQK